VLKRLAQDPAFTLMTVRGVPIRLQASIILLPLWAAFVGYAGGNAGWQGALFMVMFVVLLYACAGLHEAGHILVARKYGATVKRIRISGLGAFVLVESKQGTTGWQDLAIALGGPAASALISVALMAAAWPTIAGLGMEILLQRDAPALIVALALTNVLLTVFNLLPVSPMDGARALDAILALRLQRARAARLVSAFGQVVGVALVASGMFLTEERIFRATAFFAAGLVFWISLRAEHRAHTS
jgi:Zn-dependent protease